jgi:hypothetical protein
MECSTNARLLFIGLWNFCDDAGRHPAAAKQIKALVFPADDFTTDQIAGMLDELSANGLIRIYTAEGKQYFEVNGWHHQKIDRPQKAKYPPPPSTVAERSSKGIDGTQNSEGNTEGKGSSETNVSGVETPAEVVPLDARTALFRDGVSAVRSMTGKGDGPVRAIVGKWLKDATDDCQVVLEIIHAAADMRPADPVGWITKSLQTRKPKIDPALLDKNGNAPGDPYYGVDY